MIVSSCKDQGCIDADDFGEYESSSLRVYANQNNSNSDCFFGKNSEGGGNADFSLVSDDLKNGNYGSGISVCLTNNKCSSNSSDSDKVQCINSCIALCENARIFDVNGDKSPWSYIGGKTNLKISKDSEIYINASGIINLGTGDEKRSKLVIKSGLITNPNLITVGDYDIFEFSNTNINQLNTISSQDANSVISDIVYTYLKCIDRYDNYYFSPSISSMVLNSCFGKNSCNINSTNFQDFFPSSYSDQNNNSQNYCLQQGNNSSAASLNGSNQVFFVAANNNRSSLFFIEKNQEFSVNFSGKWSDGIQSNLLFSSDLSKTSGYDFKDDADIINGAKRLLLYIQKTPDFYEQDQYYPSSPSPLTWNCRSVGEDNGKEVYCSGNGDGNSNFKSDDSYLLLRTNNLSTSSPDISLIDPSNNDLTKPENIENYNQQLSSIFNIDNSSAKNSLNLDKDYGTFGFIRYVGDNLKPDSYDIPTGRSYDDYSENFILLSKIIRSDDNKYYYENSNSSIAKKISFKLLNSSNSSECNISYQIKNSSDNLISNLINSTINSTWTSSEITLEPRQKIAILPSASCLSNNDIVIRILLYRDIEIAKSGFVRFALIDDNDSIYNGSNGSTNVPILNEINGNILSRQGGGCRIKARILNPTQIEKEDYYEYNASDDPLNSDDIRKQTYVYLTQRLLPSIPSDLYSEATSSHINSNSENIKIFWKKYLINTNQSLLPTLKLTNPVFVRKGQKIRFDPVSWNGSYITSYDYDGNKYNNSIECGKTLVIYTEPRPAVLCLPNLVDEKINNPNCVPRSDGAQGCEAYSPKCDITTSSSDNAYCSSQCRIASSDLEKCIDDNSDSCADNLFNCKICDDPTKNDCYTSFDNINTCKKCASLTYLASQQSNTIPRHEGSKIFNQCFDLEDYTGAVRTIAINSINNSSSLDNILSSKSSQNLRLLSSFNGDYGNVLDFFSTKNIDPNTGSLIFQTNILNASEKGILKVMTIDGSSFVDIASNSSLIKNPYLNNGGTIIVEASNDLYKYANGQRMEVVACNANSSNNPTCDSIDYDYINQSIKPNGVIYLDNNNSLSPSFYSKSQLNGGNYKFDSDSGELRRITDSSEENYDCKTTSANSNFYCYSSNNYAKNEDNVRLAFRINDPEVRNCLIATENDRKVSEDCLITKSSNLLVQSSNERKICDGTKKKNDIYDSKDSSNAGKYCDYIDYASVDINQKADLCKKQYICINPYSNNSGYYDVSIRVKKKDTTNISEIINNIISPILNILDTNGNSLSAYNSSASTQNDEHKSGLVAYLYKHIINDTSFQFIVNMSITLMILFYGMGYFMGVSELKQSEIVIRFFKIGIIYLFVTPNGYQWFQAFFVQFFKDAIEYLTFSMASAFDDYSELQTAIEQKSYVDKSPLFHSVDMVLSLIINSVIHKKIISLLFYNFFGFIYLMVIYWAVIQYMYAVANAVLLYLTSQFFTSLLFGIAPIFFIFILFKQTKGYFDNWLNGLIGFALQRIFLIFTLSIFNIIIYNLIKLTLNYRVCWGEVWAINLGLSRFSLLSIWQPHSGPSYLNQALDAKTSFSSSAPSLAMILALWSVCCLMQKFITYITSLANAIAGGISSSDLGANISSSMSAGIAKLNSAATKFKDESGSSGMVSRMDNFLFKSGKIAKEQRAKDRQKIKQDAKMRGDLSRVANQSIRDFKKSPDNLLELSKLTEEERAVKFKSIRDQAIKEKGEKLGLSSKEIDRLKNQKGFNYIGDNVFGAGFAALKQGISHGGALFKNINQKGEDKNDSSLSQRQFKAAMKIASPDQRQELLNEVKDGKFDFKKTNRDLAQILRKNLASESKELLSKTGLDYKLGSKSAAFANASGKVAGFVPSAAVGIYSFLGMGNILKAANAVIKFRKNRNFYDSARKDLEDRGEIRRMGLLGNALGRNNDSPVANLERIKIRDLANRKKLEFREKNRKKPSSRNQARLDRIKNILDAKDEDKIKKIDIT